MASAAYSFIDIAVLDEVRHGLAAGDALLILDAALEEIVWANGLGADLFGFSGVEAAIGGAAGLSPVARRQLASVPGFPRMGREHTVAVRLGDRLSGKPTSLRVRGVTLPRGEAAVLIAVPAAHGAARSSEEAALDAVSGFAEAGSFAAFIREDASIAAASEGFDRLGIGDETLAALVNEVRDEEDRLVKRLVETEAGMAAVGIARLTDGPRLHLLLAIKAEEGPDAETVPEALQADDIAQVEDETSEQEDFPRAAVVVPPQIREAAGDAVVRAETGERDEWTAPAGPGEPDEVVEEDETNGREVAGDDELAAGGGASATVQEEEPDLAALVPERQDALAAEAGPVRFVWRTDAEGRFTTISDEFAAAMGAEVADVAGRRFSEVAERLGIDPDGAIAALLERRDTWSGRTVMWPLAGTELKVPVDLAALPVYDRTRHFEGFRGFGVARMADAVIEPHGIGASTAAAELSPAEDPERPDTAEAEDPFRGEKPVISVAAGPDRRQTDKVIRLAEHRSTISARQTTGDGLSATERSAFREIGDRLRRESSAGTPQPPRMPLATDHAAEEPHADAPTGTGETANGEVAAETPAPTPDDAGAASGEAMLDEDGAEIDLEADADDREAPGIAAEEEIAGEQPPDAAAAASFGGQPPEDEEDAAGAAEAEPAAAEFRPLLKLADLAPAAALAEPPALPSALCGQLSGLDRAAFIQLIGGLPMPILIHSGERLHHANREFLRITGFASLEELEAAGGLGALFAGEAKPGAGSLTLRTASGETMPVSAHLQSIPWEGGKALLLTVGPAQMQSAADRVAMLEARVAELRAIIDTATDGVVLIDGEGRVSSISRPAEALFGMDSDEIEGKPFTSLFAIESQRAAADYLARLADTGVASVLNDGREVIGREKQGGFIPLFMTIGRLPGDGGFCAVLRDITQWKRAEEDLNRARTQAERSSSQKTEFLARVSHEVRTPLNAIIGFSELMLDEKFGPIGSERYRDYLRDINRSGNHVLDLVNDLLDISKIEAGEQEMSYEAVALNEALAETVGMMQPQANRERVIIRSSFVSRLPDVVADLRSIRQIALNLLSNAIRATPAGGQVIVSTAYEPSGDIVVRVRDTGIGMSPAEIEQALKPFKQINALKRSRGDGTGLGLPLTKALVEANRARFAITSAPGHGTLVEITFPSTRVLAD